MPHRLPPFSMPITKRTATFALTCTLLCSVTPAVSQPTSLPTAVPTSQPTGERTSEPTSRPTNTPTAHPTSLPTSPPTTRQPTVEPTAPLTQRCAAVTELQPRGCCGGIASQGGQLVQLNPAEITQFACHDVCRNSSTCVAFDANVELGFCVLHTGPQTSTVVGGVCFTASCFNCVTQAPVASPTLAPTPRAGTPQTPAPSFPVPPNAGQGSSEDSSTTAIVVATVLALMLVGFVVLREYRKQRAEARDKKQLEAVQKASVHVGLDGNGASGHREPPQSTVPLGTGAGAANAVGMAVYATPLCANDASGPMQYDTVTDNVAAAASSTTLDNEGYVAPASAQVVVSPTLSGAVGLPLGARTAARPVLDADHYVEGSNLLHVANAAVIRNAELDSEGYVQHPRSSAAGECLDNRAGAGVGASSDGTVSEV
eukprot:m.448400 g.448400  ORF g.448400 m.448400 type:complete len:428 (+) comp19655_c0_seq1:115-1398(+)